MLSAVIFTPLVGALLILFINKEMVTLIKTLSLLFSLIPLALLAYLIAAFNYGAVGFQFQEKLAWIPLLNIKYHLGLDGISLPLLALTALLTTLSLVYSWIIKERPKEYFILFLILETGMLGVFSALDLFLFYVFWEVSLVPMYFLI